MSWAPPTVHGSWRRRLLADLILLLLVLLPAVAGSGSYSLLDVDEPRFACASRSMARMEPDETWIVPHFNGADRYDKPILVYWLQAASLRAFGEGERQVRLPSALAVAASASLAAGIARLLGASLVAAFVAGLALGTCALAVAMGHAATTDALLLLCTTACARAQIGRFVNGTSRASFVAMWLTAGAAFLAKGPPAWIGPLAVGCAILWAGGRPRLGSLVAGAALALAPVLAWGIPALRISDGGFWNVGVLHHVVARGTRPFEGHGGSGPQWWLFYVVTLPLTFLPWTPFLPLGVPVLRGRVSSAHPGAQRVLVGWIVGVVATFTVVASKLVHYVLPCFPALGCLIALGLDHAERAPRGVVLGRSLGRALRTLGVLVPLAVGVPLAWLELWDTALAATAAAVVFAIGCQIAGKHAAHGTPRSAALVLGAATLLGMALFASRAMPALDVAQATTKLRHELQVRVAAGAELNLYREVLPSLVYYLDRRVPALEQERNQPSAVQALEVLARPRQLLLLNARHLGDLREAVAELEQRDPAAARRAAQALEAPLLAETGVHLNKGPRTTLVLLGSP